MSKRRRTAESGTYQTAAEDAKEKTEREARRYLAELDPYQLRSPQASSGPSILRHEFPHLTGAEFDVDQEGEDIARCRRCHRTSRAYGQCDCPAWSQRQLTPRARSPLPEILVPVLQDLRRQGRLVETRTQLSPQWESPAAPATGSEMIVPPPVATLQSLQDLSRRRLLVEDRIPMPPPWETPASRGRWQTEYSKAVRTGRARPGFGSPDWRRTHQILNIVSPQAARPPPPPPVALSHSISATVPFTPGTPP